MFHKGSELKNGLIDVSKAYDYINKYEDDKDSSHYYNNKFQKNKEKDGLDMVASNQIVVQQTGRKWSKILEYMKKNPKALMEVIPSPRPGKIREALAPLKYTSLEERMKKVVKPGMPPLKPKTKQKMSQSEKEGSVVSSHYSKHTAKSMKRRTNPNSTKMVVMKPVPIHQRHGSSMKKFRLKGNIQSFKLIEKSIESDSRRLGNPFRRKESQEKEKSLYSNIWDDDKPDKEVNKKLDFYNTNRNQSQRDSENPESALDMTKNIADVEEDNLREKTQKIFNIAKNISVPKLVDWKHCNIYEQQKENTLTTYGKGDYEKLYKESDIPYFITMVNNSKKDVWDAKIIGPIHKKGLMTLNQLMIDLDMGSSFKKISSKYREVTIDNTLRILIRWKMYFSARQEILKMLSDIDKREGWLDSIRNVVMGMKDDKEIEKRKTQIQELSLYLLKITHTLSFNMDKFVKSFKQFGKTFIYDQMVRKNS